jgi:hypothetical protein
MGTDKARRLLIAEYGNFCFRCLLTPVAGGNSLDVDHIVPLSLGGRHVYENYQLLCHPCNKRKGMSVADYRPGTRSIDLIPLRPFIQPWARSRLLRRERKIVVKRLRPLRRIDGRYEWVSVAEAGARLNVSPSTIRRMVEAGQLVGEREAIGGARDRYLIRFDRNETPHEASPSESEDEADDTSPEQESSAAFLELLAELREMRRQEDERRIADASRIADLRERAGRAEERADRLMAEKEQWALDVMEQTERAVRAEAELQRLRGRRWYDPRTW